MCVPSANQDVWKKTANIYVLRLLFHIFSSLKESEMSSWNPQWQVIGHRCSTWNKSWNGVGTLNFPDNGMRKFAGPDLDMCYKVWSFGIKMQPHTTYIRHMSYCSHFTGNFSFPPPYAQSGTFCIKLSFVWVGEVVLGWSPIPQLWGSGNGCELLQVIQLGFYGSWILNSFQDGTNASMCTGIMKKN
jgi:hypothetical protein